MLESGSLKDLSTLLRTLEGRSGGCGWDKSIMGKRCGEEVTHFIGEHPQGEDGDAFYTPVCRKHYTYERILSEARMFQSWLDEAIGYEALDKAEDLDAGLQEALEYAQRRKNAYYDYADGVLMLDGPGTPDEIRRLRKETVAATRDRPNAKR